MSNQNAVTLLGYYGGDETHCLSAWQSTALDLGMESQDSLLNGVSRLYQATVATKKKSPEELLNFLATNNHHTPFEKSCLHFQVRADIATHIHFLKHRIGVSINSESARYKELKNKKYLPEDIYQGIDDYSSWEDSQEGGLVSALLDYASQLGYFGRDKLACPSDFTWVQVLDLYSELGCDLYRRACKELTKTLGRKRAKEVSRYFLPYNKQLDFDVMFNFRSFMHFQGLRNSENAQKEVQAIAQEMIELVRGIDGNPFELSLKAFGY